MGGTFAGGGGSRAEEAECSSCFLFFLSSIVHSKHSKRRAHVVWCAAIAGAHLGRGLGPAWDLLRAQSEARSVACRRRPPAGSRGRDRLCQWLLRPHGHARPSTRSREDDTHGTAGVARQRHSVAATHAPLAARNSAWLSPPPSQAGRVARIVPPTAAATAQSEGPLCPLRAH